MIYIHSLEDVFIYFQERLVCRGEDAALEGEEGETLGLTLRGECCSCWRSRVRLGLGFNDVLLRPDPSM